MVTRADKPPTNELGSAANFASLTGWPWDLSEDSPDLQWPNSVAIFDRMRRQDSQIMGTLNALTLPIRQPGVFVIDPRDSRPEVYEQIADDLGLPILGQEPKPRKRIRGRFSWAEHNRLVQLKLIYGHMPFEQLVSLDDSGASLRARLWKLAPRFPRTITKIDVERDGGLKSIWQQNADPSGRSGPDVEIGVDRLAYYCNDREGGSWQGQSILRSSYRDWTLKDRMIRVAAMTGERNGMGVPTMEATVPGATQTQMTDAAKLAAQYRSGDKASAAIPYGFKLRLVGVEGTLPDLLPLIKYFDEQITKPMQEMFMQLGSTATGSRALGTAFLDFFAMALNAVAGAEADETTQYVVEDLVDWNWGENEPAPAVIATEIDGERDIDPASLVSLIESGAVEMDDDLDRFIRQRYKLPKRNAELPARPRPTVPSVAAGRRRPFTY